ncbi:MAG: tetratricopeptide repeat protein [Brumimicrobium sp.]|nr:tetratricopeptide repeat protein [Brumimicrobium sp.]
MNFQSTNPDTAIHYLDKSLVYAKKQQDKLKEGQSILQKGWCYYIKSDYEKALQYYHQSLAIILKYMNTSDKKTKAKRLQATVLMNIGIIYYAQGDYSKTLVYYFKALKINEEIGNKQNQAINHGNIGLVYAEQGDYAEALDCYFKALKINEEIGNKAGKAANLGNIGNVYADQGDYPKALDYYFKALKISEEIGNKNGQASDLSNIGLVYSEQGDYPKALDYYFKALKISEEIGNQGNQAAILGNIGIVYNDQGDYTKALNYDFKALKINEEIGYKRGQAINLGNIGRVYIQQKKYKEAGQYIQQAIDIGEELGIIYDLKNLYQYQTSVYYQTSNYKEAYEAYKKHIMYRDSVLSEENQKATVQKEMKYEFDKKEALQKAAQDKKDAVAAEKSRKQVFQRNSFVVGFILMLGLAFMAFRSYHNKRRDNVIISKQKQEVEQQKHLVEEKNQEILDSIAYARRIQSAILPPERLVKKYLPDSFILYKPKDIVAGDFYWMEQKGDLLLFAAADCTGHGVPGAMVSVVCNHALNRSVREYNLSEPGKILDKTRELVIEEFEKSEEGVKDGMDISLCGLNLKTNTLTWSGANNPLWIIRKKDTEVEELKANKQPIGKYVSPEPFDTHTIQLETGDSIYIFTDGYQDQFGGEKGKKFKAKNMRELILSIRNQPMDNQREAIDIAFEEWKKSHDQVDDVCVIGVRI